MNTRRFFPALGMVVICAIAIGVVFGKALTFGFSAIDDSFLIAGNLAVIGPTLQAIKLAWTTYDPELYIPLTILSYHIDFLLYHLDPWWIHLEDLILHGLNVILAFVLLRKWTGRGVASALAALVFAVHPVQTETVVWLSARKDLLMTLFSLASLLVLERYLHHPRPRTLVMSALLFACALLFKPSAILLPMVMAIRMSMVRGGDWGRLQILTPFAVISTLIMAIGIFGKSHVLGLQNPFMTLGLAAQSIVWTLGKFIFLVPLRVSYDLPQPSSMTMIICVILCLGMLWVGWRSWRRLPMVTLGIAWFIALLLPPILNARTGDIFSLAADRYSYLPMIGIFIVLIGAGEIWVRSKNGEKVCAIIAGIFIVICIPLARAQTALWESPVTLFRTSLERAPDAVTTRIALVRMLQEQNIMKDAFDLLKEGLKYGDSPELHIAAGYVYARNGDVPSAKEQFGLAAAMSKESPDADYAMGSLLSQTDPSADAKAWFTKALKKDPSFVDVRIELARIAIEEGNSAEAETQLSKALRWNPSSGDAHLLTATLLQSKKDFVGAKTHLDSARLLLSPSPDLLAALTNQAIGENRMKDAEALLTTLKRLNPQDARIKILEKKMNDL